MHNVWFAYMVRCSDGSLYAGATNDLSGRMRSHNSGSGARYTRSNRPVRLVWSRAFPSKSEALREEARIKSLNKIQKEAMLPWSGKVDVLRRRNEMLALHEMVCPPVTEDLDEAAAMAVLASLCSSSVLDVREFLVHRYAWGTPTEEILRKVQASGPIVEMGAGSGYWAWLLRTLSADIVAYDAFAGPRRNMNVSSLSGISWTEVGFGGPEVLTDHSDRTLLLCWPPAGDMAFRCLDYWKGDVLAYVGDPSVTADEAFHARLRQEFREISRIRAPSWPGISDYLTVWRRA